MIQIQNLVGGYTNSPIIKGINLEVEKGEFFALLGPNGSGKTTLFKLITGQLPIQGGKVLLSDKEISSYSKLEKAKKIAVLTQEVQVSFDYTVEEIVSLGRYPHQKGILKNLSKEDRKIIDEVMEITKVSDFCKKQFRMISGGEKQRVLLAKALAQEPELLLLDEPTNHLDIKHTFELLDLLKERQQKMGLTIFSILHDLNVASLYANRIALLHNGEILDVGDVNLLRKEEQLKKVYQVEVNAQSHPVVPKPQLLMTPKYSASSNLLRFEDSYKIEKTTDYIHIEFAQPLRAISNGHIGDGIQWLKHFCQFYIQGKNSSSDLKQTSREYMEKYNIPYEQAAGMIATGKPGDMVIVKNEIDGIRMMLIVMPGLIKESNPNDCNLSNETSSINTMLFIDAHFTEGDLVDGFMCATEAKMKALQDLKFKDSGFRNIAPGTSSDSLLLAVTQRRAEMLSPDLKTVLRKAIRETVYRVTKEAVKKFLKTV